jgi:hypothetical protein
MENHSIITSKEVDYVTMVLGAGPVTSLEDPLLLTSVDPKDYMKHDNHSGQMFRDIARWEEDGGCAEREKIELFARYDLDFHHMDWLSDSLHPVAKATTTASMPNLLQTVMKPGDIHRLVVDAATQATALIKPAEPVAPTSGPSPSTALANAFKLRR